MNPEPRKQSSSFSPLRLTLLVTTVLDTVQKSSSMSRTFANKVLEDTCKYQCRKHKMVMFTDLALYTLSCFTSVLSNSLIFFCMSILFLVIFSPGRDILSSQGIHCRKIMWTWIQNGEWIQCQGKKYRHWDNILLNRIQFYLNTLHWWLIGNILQGLKCAMNISN